MHATQSARKTYWAERGWMLAVALAQGLLINVVNVWTLRANQERGVYPVDADSIGIPVVSTMVVTLLLLVVLICAILLPRRTARWRGFSSGLAAVVGVLTGLQAIGWADAIHHLPIMAVWVTASGAVLWMAWTMWTGQRK
jgi:hypothetical protein